MVVVKVNGLRFCSKKCQAWLVEMSTGVERKKRGMSA